MKLCRNRNDTRKAAVWRTHRPLWSSQYSFGNYFNIYGKEFIKIMKDTPLRSTMIRRWAKTVVHGRSCNIWGGDAMAETTTTTTGRYIRLFYHPLHLWSEWISSINIRQDARQSRATTVWDASMRYSWTYPKPCWSIGNIMLSISTHLSKHTAVAVSAENVTRIIRGLLFAKKKYLERLIN